MLALSPSLVARCLLGSRALLQISIPGAPASAEAPARPASAAPGGFDLFDALTNPRLWAQRAPESVELIRKNRSEVVLDALGDSSQNLMLRVWVDDPKKETLARFACLELSKAALDKAGIQIPFPHLQLFVDRLEDPAVEGLRQALAARG